MKVAKASAEKTKVGIRKARQKGIAEIKIKEDVSKDTVRKLEKHVRIIIISIKYTCSCSTQNPGIYHLSETVLYSLKHVIL